MLKFSIILTLSLINLLFFDTVLCCAGCIELTELTFDKTIEKFRTSLVKFDVSFPYGPNHEAYMKFAEAINNKTISGNNHRDVLIGTVSVKDYGDNENKKLADKYDIKTESFPVLKLFIEGNLEKPIHFEKGNEDLTTARLFLFLKEHSKVYIQAPGCIKELDELSEKFLNDKSQRADILKQANDVIEKIKNEKKKSLAKFYAVLMNGINENGEGFIKKQHVRMAKLLKDKLSEKKIDELTKKLNILSSFKYQETYKNEL